MIRYRTKVVQARASEIQRLGNVLQDAGIKLGNVASSIASKSGRNMIEALIDGERLAWTCWRTWRSAGCGPRPPTWPWPWKAASAAITR